MLAVLILFFHHERDEDHERTPDSISVLSPNAWKVKIRGRRSASMNVLVLRGSLIGLIGVLLWGCMGSMTVPTKKGVSLSGGYRVGDIVDTHSGRPISRDLLFRELSSVQIVYVGETHISTEDHRVQEEIITRLHTGNASLAVGMEMFSRESQPILDRFSSGIITDEVFLQEVNWDEMWGYPFRLYRPILMFAREKRIPILGLNAPREIVRKIAVNGLQSLTLVERERVAQDFHLDDPIHREYVRSQYAQHMRGSISDFDTFFEAQLAWEETMAETLAQRLLSTSGSEQIVVLVGKGHVSHRVGLPKLVARRITHTYKTVVPVPLDYRDSIVDSAKADYVWVTEKSESSRRGRLGMVIRETASGKGLEVVSVLPGSPAEKAGMKKGDLILTVDGAPLKLLEDLHKAMIQPGDRHILTVHRNREILSVTVIISP